MTSRVIRRSRRRRVRAPVIIGACVAASIFLPGHIFADGFTDGVSLPSALTETAVNVAAVEPSYAPVGGAPVAAAPVAGASSSSSDSSSVKAPRSAPTGFDTAETAETKEPAPAIAKPDAQAATKQSRFNLSQVERIRVRVWGTADLSGEYAIDPDHSLSFPRIGRIEVGDMSAEELEQMLAAKLSDVARAQVAVAIEVERFRPYFIMGQVVEAGAKEWKPGLKVIQAISLARGVTRSSGDAMSMYGSGAGPLATRQSQSQLTFALVQLARLKAEREGSGFGAATDRISSLIAGTPEADRAAVKELVERQNGMLNEQRNIMETQLSGLRDAREAAARELESAESQEQTVKAQLESTRSQLQSIEGLKEKRLISNSRYFEQKNQLLSAEISYAEARAMAARARSRVSELDQQLDLLPRQRRAELGERIEALEREVAQLRVAAGPRSGAHERDVMSLKYNIARESGDGVEMITATVFTQIRPGDVVIVADEQDAHVAAIEADPAVTTGSAGATRTDAAAEAQRLIEGAAVEPTPSILRRTSSSADFGRSSGRE